MSFQKVARLFLRPVTVDSCISNLAPQGGNNLEPSPWAEETPRKPEARQFPCSGCLQPENKTALLEGVKL